MEDDDKKFGAEKSFWKFLTEKADEIRSYLSTMLHELRAYLWTVRKKITIRFRRKLSRYLALILSAGIIIREADLFIGLKLVPDKAMPWLIGPLAVLTLFAALWEFRGNKLSDTPEDRLFLKSMRHLLTYLETQVLSDDEPGSISERTSNFIEALLALSSATLCGKKKIYGAMFLPNETQTELILVSPRRSDRFEVGLRLPVPNGDKSIKRTPGGEAFRQTKITYMPRKKKEKGENQCSLLFEVQGFRWTEHVHGWKKTVKKEHEDFRSLLCVPVKPAISTNESLPFGLLTFTTTHRDPFVTQDFQIGMCFAKLLGQALYYGRLKEEMKSLRTENGNLNTTVENELQEKQKLERQLADCKTQIDKYLQEKQNLGTITE